MLAKLCDTPTRVVTAYLAAADRREVDPPIQVEAATWLSAEQLDWFLPRVLPLPPLLVSLHGNRCRTVPVGRISPRDPNLPCCTLLPGPTSTRVAPSPSKPATSVNWCSGRRSRCGRFLLVAQAP